MNSTTDFTEIRKSPENDIPQRSTLSSVKKRPFVSRKLLNLAPLNLNEIKREVEAEKNKSINFTFDDNEFTTENESSENTLRDISNSIEIREAELASSLSESHCESSAAHVESLCKEPERKSELNPCRNPTDDSFDLDFSSLSLSTPVRKRDTAFTTPTVNKPPVCHTAQAPKFDSFVTPKVQNSLPAKRQSSNSNKPLFVTPKQPVQSYQIKRVTPFGSKAIKKENVGENVLYSMPRTTTPKDETFNKIVVNQVEYLILSLLGKGGSSEVFQCYNLVSKKLVAIKCVSLQNSSSASGYINEVNLLKQLQNCDKIIKMFDHEILRSENKLYMVLEKGGDDLSTILKKLASQSAHIPIYMLLFYWMDMLHAVRQIHLHGVIHSDLKPSNFIKADGGLKLIDFGIASSVQNDETSVIKTNPEGSCNYISPEALNSDTSTNSSSPSFGKAKYKLHYKSDVWSLGCILYQLVYRRTPFNHLVNLWSKLAYILNPNHTIEYPDAPWVPPRILDTIKKCLQYNVKSRPSVDELIQEYETKLHEI
ncbi:dual specificity protein kinase monopolar spindle 1 [Leptinotarsa decemlineata]|uniref:dual specificity protein kinase monopolar spindle 1 n=1 Tax=Leptinotarsa decemlineata TaxID=7539 RepID=UPI003D3053E3